MNDVASVFLADQVYGVLLERLSQDSMQIGTRLPGQTALAKELGVSVVVVREALARLRSQGLVESRKGAGVFVLSKPGGPSGFKVPQIADGDLGRLMAVQEVRTTIEVATAELAAKRRSPEDIEACTAAFKRLRAALAAGKEAIHEHFRFHLAIAKASQNEFYPELLQYLHHVLIQSLLASYEETRQLPRRFEQVQDEHAAILEAIVEGDFDAAGRVMRTHLTNAGRRLLAGSDSASPFS
jgi:GntR family transcriptional repressor for pyruvate dehydrogenase complex